MDPRSVLGDTHAVLQVRINILVKLKQCFKPKPVIGLNFFEPH